MIFIFCLFLIALGQALNVLGSFISVPFAKLTFWQAYQMAIPYIIIQRICVSSAIYLNHANSFLSNNQMVFLMLCIQFFFTLVVNAFYLKKHLHLSDYLAMLIFLFAYYISYFGFPFRSSSTKEKQKQKDKQKQKQK